jgi:hypothetical protein
MTSQRRDLTSALRKGIRMAKRTGDAGTVLKYQEAGNAMVLQTSGIGSYDQRKAGDFAFEQDTRTKDRTNRVLADRALNGVEKVGAMEQEGAKAPSEEAAKAPSEEAAAENTASSGGARFATRALRPEVRSALSGAFGEDAKRKALSDMRPEVDQMSQAATQFRRNQAEGLVDKYLDDEAGGFITPEKRGNYLAEAKKMGAKDESSFLSAVERRRKTWKSPYA